MEETLEGTFAMIKPDAVGKKTLPYKNRTKYFFLKYWALAVYFFHETKVSINSTEF